MEHKTHIAAEDGRQELMITREFDLPVDLLFKAYEDPELVAQWMSNKMTRLKVLELENKRHGGWRYESADAAGNVVFRAHGVIHEFIPQQKIIRTFEMEHSPFGVQLELYAFEPLSDIRSRLTMHVIYESVEKRDGVLQLPFAKGLQLAHDRIRELMLSLK